MTIDKITPVILAGGVGSRLWPVSREDLPKQFCSLGNHFSLFQETVLRLQDTSMFSDPIVITGERYCELAARQMWAMGFHPKAIISEPVGRDTAAAIALAAEVAPIGENGLMMVVPSDHQIKDETAFAAAVNLAIPSARLDGMVVTFGITPTHPETGYGYMRAGPQISDRPAYSVGAFIEKPDRPAAVKLLSGQSVYWNAGMFLFDRGAMRTEIEMLAPDLRTKVVAAAQNGTWDNGVFRPEPAAFSEIQPISFDYAVMEKTSSAALVPMATGWSDLGSWKAIWETSEKDAANNYVTNGCFVSETSDSLVYTDGPTVGVVGLDDVVVVANKDAVLVTSRENAQGVKSVVEEMKMEKIPAAVQHPGEDRPWGRFDSLDRGKSHQVKRIRVDPGQRLSLQYHHHRAEHWVVVEGVATVTVDDDVFDMRLGEQVYVPKGAVHRLENLTERPVEIIEVQIGNYLGEDDIVRVEDIYGRPATETNMHKEES